MVDFKVEDETKTLTCTFGGRMDTVQSGDATTLFNERLAEAKGAIPEGLRIVFDLKTVDYIASAFIRLCLIAAKAVEKGNFSIINTDPQVKKVFKLAGLEAMMNIS